VAVDYVHQHNQPQAVSLVNQCFELLWGAKPAACLRDKKRGDQVLKHNERDEFKRVEFK
jgi:hypothetical protein